MKTTAFVFPGQGSQSTGMLAALASDFSSVKATFDQASSVLGYDLWDLVQNDTEDKISQTHITQPALLAASVSIWRVIVEQNNQVDPEFMAGHSLGEYSALVCAGILAFDDAVKLVEQRGRFMQQAVPTGEGAMYAIIGLDDDKIAEICTVVANETKLVVSPVNYNSPGQVVIAGASSSAKIAAEQCKAAGAKRALPLAVSVPSHCALMQPAAVQLEEMLKTIELSASSVNVVNNVDVAVQHDPAHIKSALVRQLYLPVQWTNTVRFMAEQGVTRIVEVGPGKVLSGLNKRIDKTLTYQSANTPDTIAIDE